MWILGLKGLNTMFPNFISAGVQKGHILASSKLVTLFILLQLMLRPTVQKMSQTHTREGFTWLAFFENVFFMTASFKIEKELRSTTTQKSATVRERIIALNRIIEISSAVNEPRKIVNLFPVMVSNERNQPRIQNQVSIRINS